MKEKGEVGIFCSEDQAFEMQSRIKEATGGRARFHTKVIARGPGGFTGPFRKTVHIPDGTKINLKSVKEAVEAVGGVHSVGSYEVTGVIDQGQVVYDGPKLRKIHDHEGQELFGGDLPVRTEQK